MMLEEYWADIGWELERARTRDDMASALKPLRSHNRAALLEALYRPATEKADAKDIRATLRERRKLVENRRGNLKPRADDLCERCKQGVRALDDMLAKNKNLPVRIADMDFLDKLFESFSQWQSARAALEAGRKAIDALELKHLNQEAYFVQAEMLRFVCEKRYAFTPRRFASAFAGLPDMTYRQSLWRCGKEPFHSVPELSYRLFDFVRRVWENRQNSKPDHVMELLEARMRKVRSDTSLYDKLSSSMGDLGRAVAEAIKASRHPQQVPYLITTCFERNLARPKTQVELFMDAASKG